MPTISLFCVSAEDPCPKLLVNLLRTRYAFGPIDSRIPRIMLHRADFGDLSRPLSVSLTSNRVADSLVC
jgi:hypothetical protein